MHRKSFAPERLLMSLPSGCSAPLVHNVLGCASVSRAGLEESLFPFIRFPLSVCPGSGLCRLQGWHPRSWAAASRKEGRSPLLPLPTWSHFVPCWAPGEKEGGLRWLWLRGVTRRLGAAPCGNSSCMAWLPSARRRQGAPFSRRAVGGRASPATTGRQGAPSPLPARRGRPPVRGEKRGAGRPLRYLWEGERGGGRESLWLAARPA